MADIYARLATFLDQLPAGFPATESGVEQKILRKLFTPEEAELVMHLTLIEEEARVVAFRARQPVEKVAPMLESLERRGLIYATHQPGKPAAFSVSQFVVGFWEGQVDKLDRELAELYEAYLPELQEKGSWTRVMPQMRTIPVGVSIPITSEVLHYERAEEIVRANTAFAVRNCVCRQEQELLGKRCDKPMETCLQLGSAAVDGSAAGLSRMISREEALEILRVAEEKGMVLQPANSQDPIFICTCCACCCGILRMLKRHEKPASLVSNPFIAQHNPDTCSACGTCTERCPMGAITMEGGVIAHNPDRCIGCGLCVSTCPTSSMTMVRKPADAVPAIPKNTLDTYIRLGQKRDPLFLAKMAGVVIRSQVDRTIAPKK